jgi:hypothetical protein
VIGFASYFANTAPGLVLGYLQTNVDDRRAASPGSTPVLVYCATIFDVSANEANFRKRSQSGKSNENNVRT